MEYVHIPVVWSLTHKDLTRFFAALEEHRGRKVFVHCLLNMRVTAFVFLYRVLRRRWVKPARSCAGSGRPTQGRSLSTSSCPQFQRLEENDMGMGWRGGSIRPFI